METRRVLSIFALALCALLAATPSLWADTTGATPDEVFRNLGLVRDGKWLILQDETELHERVWRLQQSDEAVRGETSTHRSLMPELISGYAALDSIADQRDTAQKHLDSLKDKVKDNTDDQSIDDFNNTLAQVDVLSSKYIREDEAIDGLIEREGQVEEARARFISGVMDMQGKAEALASAYTQLAQNAALSAAITQANANADTPLTLGPSLEFSNDLEFLNSAAGKIVSASVVVPKSSTIGGLHVLPTLNGKLTISMIWDSGCSFTKLSAQTASALGLKLTDHDPDTEAVIANGNKVKGKLVFLDSIQLGPFTLHDVLCEVSLDDQGMPMDLLGNSFQSHFLTRLDQQSGRLQLTPIDSSVEIGTVAASEFASGTHVAVAGNQPPARPKDEDLARLATATASSTLDGSTPRGAIDGIVAGAPESPRNEWASDDSTGSITLTWDQPMTISSAKLWDRVDQTDHILSGRLVFDDGSSVPFGELPTDQTPLSMHFGPQTTRWVRFEILTVSPGTEHPGFAEIQLFQ